MHVVNEVRGWAPTCSAATSTETRSRGSTEHVLDMRISCFVMVYNVRRGSVIAYV